MLSMFTHSTGDKQVPAEVAIPPPPVRSSPRTLGFGCLLASRLLIASPILCITLYLEVGNDPIVSS